MNAGALNTGLNGPTRITQNWQLSKGRSLLLAWRRPSLCLPPAGVRREPGWQSHHLHAPLRFSIPIVVCSQAGEWEPVVEWATENSEREEGKKLNVEEYAEESWTVPIFQHRPGTLRCLNCFWKGNSAPGCSLSFLCWSPEVQGGNGGPTGKALEPHLSHHRHPASKPKRSLGSDLLFHSCVAYSL